MSDKLATFRAAMSQPGLKADWKAVSIKFEPRIDELLAQEAERECRTKADQLRWIVQSYFERERDDD